MTSEREAKDAMSDTKGASRPASAAPSRRGATLEQLDKGYRQTKSRAPQWHMAGKPKMISGDAVPSWVESIPGPKYTVDVNKFKKQSPAWTISNSSKKSRPSSAPAEGRASAESIERGFKATTKSMPQWTMGTKPAMVIGGSVPSWVNSIPGPKYSYSVDKVKKAPPNYSLGEKLDFVVGGSIPSWVNSIPGPKYAYDADVFKARQPVYSIGEKLPTESDLKKKRSPGPIYGGAAGDATKQSLVDSTRKRTCAPSFGIGARWEGSAYEMILSGAWCRYE